MFFCFLVCFSVYWFVLVEFGQASFLAADAAAGKGLPRLHGEKWLKDGGPLALREQQFG